MTSHLYFSLLNASDKRPKHVERLPHVCMSLYIIIVQLLEYTVYMVTCLIARNVDNFKMTNCFLSGFILLLQKENKVNAHV